MPEESRPPASPKSRVAFWVGVAGVLLLLVCGALLAVAHWRGEETLRRALRGEHYAAARLLFLLNPQLREGKAAAEGILRNWAVRSEPEQKRMKRLLALGIDLNIRLGRRTALSSALENHDRGSFKRLVELGADPKLRDPDTGRTLLHELVVTNTRPNGVPGFVPFLLDLGLDPNAEDDDGDTPLALLAQASLRDLIALPGHAVAWAPRRLEAAANLLGGGANLGLLNGEEGGALLFMAYLANDAKAIEALGAPKVWSRVEAMPADSDLVRAAAACPTREPLEFLLSRGLVDPADLVDPSNQLLPLAVSRGADAVALNLLERGADPETPGEFDVLPFDLAINMVGGEIGVPLANALLTRGADPNRKHGTGLPRLLEAAKREKLALVRALLAAGADPNVADGGTGKTPLHFVCDQGDPATAKALLDAGADPAARDKDGLTARFWAVDGGNKEIVAMIEEALEKRAAGDSSAMVGAGSAAEEIDVVESLVATNPDVESAAP